MRVCKRLILHFLLISLCYCHDLNHIDPVAVAKPETTTKESNVHDNRDSVEAQFYASQGSQNPSTPQTDGGYYAQSTQFTTPSVKQALKTQVPLSIPNDVITPSTPLQTQTTVQPTTASPVTHTTTNIPISNDINTSTLSSTHSEPHEQIKPISDHFPSPYKAPEIISTTTPNSMVDSHATIPNKPVDTISTDTSTAKPESHIPGPTPLRMLRSATPNAHLHPRHIQEPTAEPTNRDKTPQASAVVKESNELHSTVSPSAKPEQIRSEITQQPAVSASVPDINNRSEPKEQPTKSTENLDLPRQVRVHSTATILNQQDTSNISSTTEHANLTLKKEADNDTAGASVLAHDTTAHVPRTHGLEEKQSIGVSISQTNETKVEGSTNSSISKSNVTLNITDKLDKYRQICWRLPKRFEPSIELLENQIFRSLNVLPDFVQTVFLGPIEDREVLMNTMWFGSVCTMCVLFSFLFLSMGTKRLKQSKTEQEVRARCQQLQQHNNQIELERATFERQNQKLSDEIDELRSVPMRDADEDIFALREECARFQEELKTARAERDALQQTVDHKQHLIQKHEYEMQRQVETVAYLNNESLQLKQELEKERATIGRYQSNDLSLERFEKSQELIQELKAEITQLKQEKFAQKDQLHEIQEQASQLDIEKNQLVLRMKQLKDLLEQRDQTIKRIQEKINEEEPKEFEDLLSLIAENSSGRSEQLLSTVDVDLEKSNQHIRDLHHEIDEKTRRIKELDLLIKQEKGRCREMETKLKVVLELRERDAHLHIRQLGQTDAELRKARNDTERVRILQQQLDLKQQQLEDVQKVLSTEQMKFNEECSKLQHDTHEKWMEVKRLVRELDVSKKECEGLRKQITKYANNERSSQEKTVIKPVPQHYGNNGQLQTNGNSPNSYQQTENFRPIDHQRNESGATSPAEMFMPRPPLFGFPRPPFFPAPNAFIMHPRFPMPTASPHGMISPLSHLMINGNDANKSENTDPLNITPASTSYNEPSSERILSAAPENEKPTKTKKSKKSSKKKGEPSVVKENV